MLTRGRAPGAGARELGEVIASPTQTPPGQYIVPAAGATSCRRPSPCTTASTPLHIRQDKAYTVNIQATTVSRRTCENNTTNRTPLDAMPTPLAELAERVTPLPPLPQLIAILLRRRPWPPHRITPLSLRPKVDVTHLAPQTIVALIVRSIGRPRAFPPRPARGVSPLRPSPRLLYNAFPHPLLPNLTVPPYNPRPNLLLRGLVVRVRLVTARAYPVGVAVVVLVFGDPRLGSPPTRFGLLPRGPSAPPRSLARFLLLAFAGAVALLVTGVCVGA